MSLTEVNNGVEIEVGSFRQKRDADGDPIVRYADVVQYFEDGGEINKIHTVLGPNVFKIPFMNAYKKVLARK